VNARLQDDTFPGEPSLLLEPVPVDWLDVLPPQADCLRDYQAEQLRRVAKAMRSGYRRILVQLPTGGGKTHEIAAIVAAAAGAGLAVLILATRTRLVHQLHERFAAFGIRHGVIAAPLKQLRDYSARVQIASADTLHRRAIVNGHIPLPSASVVLFDEAHLATADTRLNLLERYPAAIRIGFTATPARKSGKSLGVAFDCLILGRSIRELTAAGTLVPTKLYNTPIVSTKELKALPKDTDNDYQTAALGELLTRPKLIGDVRENWLRLANGTRTLVFAVNKAHAAALLVDFQRVGIAAEMLTDDDEESVREEVLGRLESGSTRVVINCFLLSYGCDLPSVETIVLARPTRSLVMFLQMCGRGLRPSTEIGKEFCRIVDHGRVIENLGLPQSDFPWTLDAARNVNREALERVRKISQETMRTCRECAAIWMTSEQGHACPSCGWRPAPTSRPVRFQQADLEEMADPETAVTVADPRVERFFREALGYRQRHSPQKWHDGANKVRFACWCRTRERFEFDESVPMPSRFWELPAIPASIDVAGWMKSRDIRWARSKRRAA
jgi:superfamily II DNA or RNA helicase